MTRSALSQLAQRTPEPPISWLMSLALDRPDVISLAAGFTDNDSLPVEETRGILDEVLRSARAGRPALQYGSTVGDPRLRELTSNHLRQCDGRKAGRNDSHDPARILITSGSQQLLYICTEALCDKGDIVLVEDPTYFVYLSIAQSHGLRCRGVHMAEDGVDTDHLRSVLETLKRSGELPRVKLLYLVSYFQNPTGRTSSLQKKEAALALLREYERAAGHPIYLLEDAAYRELRFAGPDVPSALITTYSDRVIYAGTYSKPFATGVRVGYGVLPGPLFTAATRIKGNHDFGTPNLLQQLVSHVLASGVYDRHLSVLRQRYAAKAATMSKAIRAHFPATVQWVEPTGGLYVWARLPARQTSGRTSKLFASALERNVVYVPGQLCYCDDPARRRPNNEMRISFGGARDKDIAEGIRRLGEVIRTYSVLRIA